MVMPFDVKKGPPTFEKTINKTFKKFDQFMKIFLDDFIIYNDMESHLMKLRLYFQKIKKYKFSRNLMIFSGLILGFVVSKEGKIPNPNKV
jgi:hypothetical protein